MNFRNTLAIAQKMIDTLGPEAKVKMDAIVAAHTNSGDVDGARFWLEISDVVRAIERGSRMHQHR